MADRRISLRDGRVVADSEADVVSTTKQKAKRWRRQGYEIYSSDGAARAESILAKIAFLLSLHSDRRGRDRRAPFDDQAMPPMLSTPKPARC